MRRPLETVAERYVDRLRALKLFPGNWLIKHRLLSAGWNESGVGMLEGASDDLRTWRQP